MIDINGTPYPIIITHRASAKRYVLRYDQERQSIMLTIPRRASIRRGLEFARSKSQWILDQIHRKMQNHPLLPGVVFPLLGVPTMLAHEPGRGLASLEMLQPDEQHNPSIWQQLNIHGDEAFFASRLRRYLSQHLKDFVAPTAQHYAQQLGTAPRKISIRDTRSHWGSCTPQRDLSFAFRLVFARQEIVEYLIAHEVAHLKEMNHSARFWQLVAELCPSYAQHRRWLKTHGHELQKYIV